MKKMKKLQLKSSGIGYREREWRMPKMEDLFKVKELKI